MSNRQIAIYIFFILLSPKRSVIGTFHNKFSLRKFLNNFQPYALETKYTKTVLAEILLFATIILFCGEFRARLACTYVQSDLILHTALTLILVNETRFKSFKGNPSIIETFSLILQTLTEIS